MPRGAYVVNRFHVPPPSASTPPTLADASRAIDARHLRLDDDGAERLVQAHRDAVRLSAMDAMHVRSLGERSGGRVPVVCVPELTGDVRDLRALADVADVLMRPSV